MSSWAAVVLAPRSPLPEVGDQDWYYRVYEWRNAQSTPTSLADFADATGTVSQVALENLFRPRAGWRKVGGAWLLQDGRPDAFDFRQDEQFGTLEVLYEAARARGGENLLAWTFGGAVHLLVHRSPEQGARPRVFRASFRCEPYLSGRHPAGWERLRRAFEGSALPIDLERLREQWAAPRLHLPAWFAALGAKGVEDVDPEGAWRDFREAAVLLLRGASPPAPLLKRVNRHLPKERALKAKGKPGATARAVAEAAVALSRSVGPGLAELFRAADLAGAIAGGEALGRLTTGSDKSGLGASASFGRLLAHYPADVLRDPLFHALSGLRTEAVNGHPYVPAWFRLAETAASAGFTLAVYPSDRVRSFRKAFGLREGEEDVVHEGWMGEAFVDLGNPDPRAALEAWFAKEKCEGRVVRAEPDGRVAATRFEGGRALPEPPGTHPAAAALDSRGLLQALGLPDVLEPGELAGRGGSASYPGRQASAHALLEGLPSPEPVPDLEVLEERFATVDSGLPFEEMVRRKDPTLACRVTLPRAEDAETLRADLERVLQRPPWREGAEVWLAGHALRLDLVARAAGDVPPGTRVAFTAQAGRRHYEVALAQT